MATSLPAQVTKQPTDQGKGTPATKVDGKPDPNIKPVLPGQRRMPWVKPLPPEELVAAKAKLSGAAAKAASFEVTCVPAIVTAGSRGKMRVLMTFHGDAVMLDPPPVTFQFEPQQGALTVLGEPKFLPSDSGGLAPALKGVAAYDNYAILEVPFEVAADAQPSQQHLELSMRYELFNGKKGGPVGTFTDQLGVDLKVASEQLKDVALVKARRNKQPLSNDVVSQSTAMPAPTEDKALSGNANPVSNLAATEEQAPQNEPIAVPVPTPWTLYGVAGALLALIALLLARRR